MSRRFLLGVLVLLTAVGCDANGKLKPSEQKNAATAQWQNARAAVMITLARDQFNSSNFDGARTTLSNAIKLAPKNSELRVLSARIAIEQGNLEVAEAELREAQICDPKNASADYYYGIVMQRWQRLPRALELYTSASDKAPTEVGYVLARAETMVALEKDTEALQLLQKAATNFENSAEVRSAVGQVLMRQRKFSEAADVIHQAVMLSADDNSLREQLARALYQAGRLPEAADVLERLLKAEAYSSRADLFMMRGECLLAANKPRDARAAFETASNLQPNNVQYILNLAKVSLESGDVRRAEIAVRKALGLSPTDGQANLLLGCVRSEQGKHAEALAAFRRATTADPKDTVALCMTGMVLEKLGRRDEARTQYEKALSVKPDDDFARKLMAQLDGVAHIDGN